MKIQKTRTAALALAGALAIIATTPSFAKNKPAVHANVSDAQQSPASDEPVGYFAPGFTGYGRQAYNPEQPTDPDPRIGGALKMSTDR